MSAIALSSPRFLLLSVIVAGLMSLTTTGVASTVQSEGERPPPDERSLAYQYDSQLGWFPKANDEVRYTGTRTIHIAHNERGFRDKPHNKEKTKPRLVVVGDSFVWGYDVEADERFTERLQARTDDIEVLNLGVSGYGTDQCYLLLQKVFDFYEPDGVIYLFSETDLRDNAVNFNHRAYYKPYYVVTDDGLELRGVPVPRTGVWRRVRGFLDLHWPRFDNKSDITPLLISAMKSFVESKGANFAVGLIDEHEPLREYLTHENIVFFDLTFVDGRYRYPGHGFHWTPEGHEIVAQAVYAFLVHNTRATQATREP